MVQLSKRKLKPQVIDKMFLLLFDVLGTQSTQAQFNYMINGLFSPTEKIMIAKRIAVLFLIIKGEEWNAIRETLKVSLSTISKCQMIVLNNVEMKNILAAMTSKHYVDIFFDELFLAFFGPETAYTNWKISWKLKNKLEQKKAEIF